MILAPNPAVNPAMVAQQEKLKAKPAVAPEDMVDDGK
jgi:hypothetical protein